MDDLFDDDADWLGSETFDSEADDSEMTAVKVTHFLVFVLLVVVCRRYCCRKEEGPEQHVAEAVLPAQLQPQKFLSTCYMLMLLGGPLANAHLFYLERIIHGLLAVWTMNFMGAGWLLDVLLMPCYLRSFNAERTTASAPGDLSRRKLFFWLPVSVMVILGSVAGTILYLPVALHRFKVVDIDRLAAQTEVNPYELLGLHRSATLQQAKAAYRRKSLEAHPDRNPGCGKPCEDKMAEITKAFDLIKRRRAPPPPDRGWESFVKDVGSDWYHLIEALANQFHEDSDSGRSDL